MNYHESNNTAPSHARSIAEAQTLVKRCAEPRPVGDQVKAAIHRASSNSQMEPHLNYAEGDTIAHKRCDSKQEAETAARLLLAEHAQYFTAENSGMRP